MAAVLACGDNAAVSHWSAAELWQMLPGRGPDTPVNVTVVHGRIGRRPGVCAHHVRTLRPDETTKHDGIPITTPARTLYDLASAGATDRELERALASAFDQRLTTRSRILSLLSAHPARGGGGSRIRVLLEPGLWPAMTRSEAEERFLGLVRKAQLRKPGVNVRVEGRERDFCWRTERLVVEVDGRAFHSSGRSFEQDRRRDAELVAAGFRVMRVTWRQMAEEPEALMVRLALALARPAGV
jgi:very-short-patch-repair endonuclease